MARRSNLQEPYLLCAPVDAASSSTPSAAAISPGRSIPTEKRASDLRGRSKPSPLPHAPPPERTRLLPELHRPEKRAPAAAADTPHAGRRRRPRASTKEAPLPQVGRPPTLTSPGGGRTPPPPRWLSRRAAAWSRRLGGNCELSARSSGT